MICRKDIYCLKSRDDAVREKMNGVWKDMVLILKKDYDKGDETFIKEWLRAYCAETIHETKAGVVNKDFDIISDSFHKWVRDEHDKLGLDYLRILNYL